jgi:hypothetical protein
VPVPAVAENGDGLIAWQASDRSVQARPFDLIPETRSIQQPGDVATLTNAAFGPSDAARGMDADGNRAGDVVVAFVQGEEGGRRIVAAAFDRAPGDFRTTSTSRFRKFARPPLRWGTSFELWGPLTYRVEIDGRPIGETNATEYTPVDPIADGVHRWRVVAIDRRGQATATPMRLLRVDASPPTVAFKVSGARKRGGTVRVAAQVSDASGSAAKASGLKSVRIDFGDGSPVVTGRTAAHRYGRTGNFTVRVSATDVAGNAVAVTRKVRIR